MKHLEENIKRLRSFATQMWVHSDYWDTQNDEYYRNIRNCAQSIEDIHEKQEVLHDKIYHAYHHGTKEDLDTLIKELVFQIEYDWSEEYGK